MVKDVLLVGFGAVGAISNHNTGTGMVCHGTENGMHFKSRKYGDIPGWMPDRLCNSVAEAADVPYSYVIVTSKAIPEASPTSKILEPLLTSPYADQHPQPAYVLIQNGLNVEKDLYAALVGLGKTFPPIISSSVYIGTNLLAPGVVQHNDFDRLTLGVYRPGDYTTATNTPEEQALLSDFAELITAGGGGATVVPEVQRAKFSKNFWNVAFSSYTTLTGYPTTALFRPAPSPGGPTYEPYVAPITAEAIETYTIPALRATLRELLALGHALGFPDSEDGLPSSTVDKAIENTRALHVRSDSVHKPSMMLDSELGRPMEVEVILGEVVRMAKQRSIDIPRIETLYALLLVKQNQILRQLGK